MRKTWLGIGTESKIGWRLPEMRRLKAISNSTGNGHTYLINAMSTDDVLKPCSGMRC